MSDVLALKLPHSHTAHSSTFQGHIPMHSILIFQDWPIKQVTKLDSVNQQFNNLCLLKLVSQLAEAMYKLAACSKSN